MQPRLSADLAGGEYLSRAYPAVANSVPRAREEINHFAESAGATADQLESIRLAVSEATTNVVMHAYEGSPGEIQLNARLDADDLLVEVIDEGLGLRPQIGGPGLGVGLALITQVADALTISTRDSGGIAVQMRFGLGFEGTHRQPAGEGAV